MNKIIGLIALLFIASCKEKVKDYVTLNGTLKAKNVEEIVIQSRNFSKTIKVEQDGSFSDTLKVVAGVHAILNEKDRTSLFLKNGYDLNIELKGNTLADGLSFSGVGTESNNFLSDLFSFYSGELGDPETYFSLEKEAFIAKVEEAKSVLKSFRTTTSELDSLVLKMDETNRVSFFKYIESNYEKEYANMVKFASGKPSPTFINYKNYKGGKTSLSDFKGKYVYIDVWATWCGPCKREIPSLKILEEEYRGKNIEFVSISVDNVDGKRGSYAAWEEMVGDKKLGGTQLFADNDFNSQFIRDYGINSIPRFILIDPKGAIVDANALRPSNPLLKKQLEDLGI